MSKRTKNKSHPLCAWQQLKLDHEVCNQSHICVGHWLVLGKNHHCIASKTSIASEASMPIMVARFAEWFGQRGLGGAYTFFIFAQWCGSAPSLQLLEMLLMMSCGNELSSIHCLPPLESVVVVHVLHPNLLHNCQIPSLCQSFCW
jgi:hypothetical protein